MPKSNNRAAEAAPLRPQSQETRDSLVRAGLELFATHGYHPTKVSDIVRHSGVTQAVFYWYFKSKLELAIELITAGRKAMLQTIGRGYRKAPASVPDMVANSQQWIGDVLKFAQENRHFMAIMLARGHGADPLIDREVTKTRTDVYAALRRNIMRATELGMLPESANVDARAAFVHRLIEGSIEWWLFGHGYDLTHEPPLSAEELAQQLAHFEFFGLLGPERAVARSAR